MLNSLYAGGIVPAGVWCSVLLYTRAGAAGVANSIFLVNGLFAVYGAVHAPYWASAALWALGSAIAIQAGFTLAAVNVVVLALSAVPAVVLWDSDNFLAHCTVVLCLPAAAVIVDWDINWIFAVEATAIWLAIVSSNQFEAKFTHLTWWALFILMVIDVTCGWAAANRQVPIQFLRYDAVVISGTVAAGVIVMSTISCDLITSAHRDLGDTKYILGNFVVHFYPLIRAVINFDPNGCPSVAGLFIIWVYSLLHNPAAVYSCRISKLLIQILLCGAAGIVWIGLWFVRHRRTLRDAKNTVSVNHF